MGSSKKHKDKDREGKEHKRKHKHRSRSRSKDRESKKRKHRDRSRDRSDEKRKRRDDYDEEGEIYDDVKIKSEPVDNDAPAPKSAGGDVSLSIEETNKLRAKLGLKPLEVPNENEPKEEKESLKDDIHKPAVNLTELKKTEELKAKLAAAREKRMINKKLGKVKTLGDVDSDDDDSAMAWVMKSRKKQKEKEAAEKRAKMLEEMDEEFGLGSIIEEEFGTKKKKQEYTSKHLTGLKVQHKAENFKEGQSVILTLADKGILDEDGEGDTLTNINIQELEKAEKNLEVKRKGPGYKAYEDDEVDEFGMMKVRNVLDKYDEELEGPKLESFELGSGGKYNAEHERNMARIRAELKQQGQSLTLAAPSLASEYYTQDEMSKFKKVKKKVRKIRKKGSGIVKADDLIPLDEPGSRDLGSRRRNRGEDVPEIKQEPSEYSAAFMSGMGTSNDMDIDKPNWDPNEADILGPEEDLTNVQLEEDEAQKELQIALEKTRKLKQKKHIDDPDRIAARIQSSQNAMEVEEHNEGGASIVLNSISEFCRTLGDIPTYGLAGNREEERDEILDMELEMLEKKKREEEEEHDGTGWEEVDIDTRPVEIGEDEAVVLDDEPVLNTGIGGALALAQKKGYITNEMRKIPTATRASNLAAKDYAIEDKRHDDIDEKYKKRDRFASGIVTDFKEKDGYKPDVKIEYVDDKGRLLNSKEAFRQLSHRFHGKGSGKKKTEKRSKKLEEEQLLLQMSSTDTPLNTVARLGEKLEKEKTPFLLLSGSKGINSTGLTK